MIIGRSVNKNASLLEVKGRLALVKKKRVCNKQGWQTVPLFYIKYCNELNYIIYSKFFENLGFIIADGG